MVEHSTNDYQPTLYNFLVAIYVQSDFYALQICRNSCVPNGNIKTALCETWSVRCGENLICWFSYSLIFEVPGLGSTWSANFSLDLIFPYFWGARFSLDLIFPYFWGARFGEYLVCQLFVGPHIPLFLRCQVWGVPGLPTFRWTSYSPIFEVPGLGSTWSANFSLDLIFLYFLGARFGEYLVCQLFVGPHIPYFWGARFEEYLVCQLFIGPHIPYFWRCQFWRVPGLPAFCWTSYSPGLDSSWPANF